jgi:hypothetical protein
MTGPTLGNAMDGKTPVILVVLVQTSQLRWFVASIDPEGRALPLLRSQVGDLEKYRGLDFDGQVSFLRHRFCGVLQRGCDRLWSRAQKARQFAVVFEEPLPEPTGQMTAAIAEHFVQWLLNPPVVVYTGTAPLDRVAGTIDPPLEELLRSALAPLLAAREDADAWELAPAKAPA